MTPFEQGYAGFLKDEPNPYDKKIAPYSHGQWERGWVKAKADKDGKEL